MFDTVHEYWSSLPEESRPKLYLYGLSLGSYGVGSVLNSISIVNEPIDGALMSGPPFVDEDCTRRSWRPGIRVRRHGSRSTVRGAPVPLHG